LYVAANLSRPSRHRIDTLSCLLNSDVWSKLMIRSPDVIDCTPSGLCFWHRTRSNIVLVSIPLAIFLSSRVRIVWIKQQLNLPSYHKSPESSSFPPSTYTSNLQLSTFNFQLSTSTFNFQPSTFNLQLSTFNFQFCSRCQFPNPCSFEYTRIFHLFYFPCQYSLSIPITVDNLHSNNCCLLLGPTSIKFNQIQSNSIKFNQIQSNPIKSDQIQWNSMKFNQICSNCSFVHLFSCSVVQLFSCSFVQLFSCSVVHLFHLLWFPFLSFPVTSLDSWSTKVLSFSNQIESF
jgi:hypothetical protein